MSPIQSLLTKLKTSDEYTSLRCALRNVEWARTKFGSPRNLEFTRAYRQLFEAVGVDGKAHVNDKIDALLAVSPYVQKKSELAVAIAVRVDMLLDNPSLARKMDAGLRAKARMLKAEYAPYSSRNFAAVLFEIITDNKHGRIPLNDRIELTSSIEAGLDANSKLISRTKFALKDLLEQRLQTRTRKAFLR